MEKRIDDVFSETVKSYENILKRYYPSHGSNGFTERNITFNFSHNYLAKNEKAIIWQECPLKDGKHFDTLIIDDEKEAIIIVEAKRLQNEKKLESVVNDFNRINEYSSEIKLDDNRLTYRKYGLLLIDVWISKTKESEDIRAKLLNKLNLGTLDKDTIFPKQVDLDYTDYSEKYHLAYKLFSVDKQNALGSNTRLCSLAG